MNRLCTATAATVVLLGSIAHAAPPTVVPSPGYDARLQEQHKALSAKSTPAMVQPVTPPRHRAERKH
jgi:hypothetical protein